MNDSACHVWKTSSICLKEGKLLFCGAVITGTAANTMSGKT
jgi:hypothetical protein